jgi:5-formyltetrahydrofolate cyclo-ligase
VDRDLIAKPELREHTWRLLELRRVVRFPGAKGRIPNFAGAERAALVLQILPIWRRARVIKVNPDAPQIPVRRMALKEGKIVYMAVPKLCDETCFIELDPARLRCGSRYPKPRGIYWEFLTAEKIASVPALKDLHGRLG